MHMVAVNSRMTFIWPLLSLFIHPLPFPPRSNAEARERRSFACAFVFWCRRPSRDVAVLSVLCFFSRNSWYRLFDARRNFCSLYPFPFFCFRVWKFGKSHFICFPSVLFRFILASFFYSFLASHAWAASGLTSCCSCFIFLLLEKLSSHLLVV